MCAFYISGGRPNLRQIIWFLIMEPVSLFLIAVRKTLHQKKKKKVKMITDLHIKAFLYTAATLSSCSFSLLLLSHFQYYFLQECQ